MNKNNSRIYIDRLFPNVNEMRLHHKLKINRESIMYITIPNDAEQITKIVSNHGLKYYEKSQDISITDGTAGVGGNTISFSYKFKSVIAIEIDQERFNYLLNNINAYQITNVDLLNGNCLDIIPNLNTNNIIFLDPPWGGKKYKTCNKIRLSLGNYSIEEVCLHFLNKDIMTSVPNLIVLKLPKNYDVENVYKKLVNKNDNERRIYFYELNKMIIIVIENGYYSLPSSSTTL